MKGCAEREQRLYANLEFFFGAQRKVLTNLVPIEEERDEREDVWLERCCCSFIIR